MHAGRETVDSSGDISDLVETVRRNLR